jgi:predicted metal-dependent peptidase
MTRLPDIITKARARLLVRAPFFGAIALGLRWMNAPAVLTMATDGRTIWFNPAWCEEHGVERIMGVTAHEVLHVVNKHHLRRAGRDQKLWNIAADLMINRLLEEDTYILPPGLLFDRDRRFAGLATETIYARLLEERKQDRRQPPRDGSASPDTGAGGDASADEKPGPGDADGATGGDAGADAAGTIRPAEIWGEVRDLTTESGRPLSPAEQRQAEQDLDVRIRQAAAAAKRAGKLPGGWREMIEATTNQVDWRDTFRMTFDGTLRGDMSWARPNRRFIQHGLYLPGWRRTGAGRVAFVLDTSGSISTRELAVYTAGILGILEETGPEEVALIQCDTEVRLVSYLQPGETFDRIEVAGSGGTRFQPAFDWIAESGFAPNVIVYATDLRSCDEPNDPAIPVIWLTPTRGGAVPFGEIVPVSL